MEWLTDNIVMPLMAALTAWFWYDKRQRDLRLSKLETRVSASEQRTTAHEGDRRVLEERLTSMHDLMGAKFESIQRALTRLEDK